MKTTLKLFSLLFIFTAFVSCSDDDGDSASEFVITEVSPTSATVGAEIVITGTDFPTDTSDISLTFNGVEATIVSATSTKIVATVPSGASTGELLLVANGYTKSFPTDFTVLSDLVSETVSNLEAPQTGGQGEPVGGPFTKFSFESGAVTDSETDWDIAFRGTTIAVNGGTATGTEDEPVRNGEAGVSIESGVFSDITSAEGLTFTQDSEGAFAIATGSDNGWYNYNSATYTIAPIPGKILVFRTHDGKYAKVEIISYYRDAPAEPDPFSDESRVYTFNYTYNPNEGETALE
ncbi:IPT/TIG domain-containing protein [Maribacter sp. MMG018]|uniref:IPT/TIG domain-containing protein n=1 Tax=Maribacter sp. MMG018 TaxID=2822688 RepID=UPI001B396A05|nr:IPT/TIG domain-containing protein [Maribacter sp. MMG018]MBQ4914389.1 IPT/TIG domain-containing protein [Maribacter sp. MMG018]